MRKLKTKQLLAVTPIILMLVGSLILAGCGKKGNVSEIIKNYQKYVGKEVELSGYKWSPEYSTEWSYCVWDEPNKKGEQICVIDPYASGGGDNIWIKSKVMIRMEGPLIYAEFVKPIEIGD